MRNIEDLRGIHKDKEILIIGSGSSLDDFPDKFFKDKITIALNWTIIRFPNCTYWHGHHEGLREYLRDEKPEFLEKSIISFPFPGPFKHGRITDRKEFFGDLVSKPIWLKFGDIRPIPRSAFEKIVEDIMEKQDDCRYRASGTVAHTAVEAAAVMGAKYITMIGCEHRGPSAQSGGIGDYKKNRNPNYNPNILLLNGTQWLAELLEPHGIEVRRYFYDSGYESII